MSKDLARQKRIQAGLSLGGAALGLSALGTKGGAVATRAALKRAPKVAGRLRLTPKGADAADKASIGLVTTASGVGGASGIHFARLQQAEAKKEDRVSKNAFGVSKNVVDMESRRIEADRHRAKANGQRQYRKDIEAGRFIRVGQDPDDHPSTPQRSLKPVRKPLLGVTRHPKDFGGINPEAKRQRRSQGAQAGLAGAAGAAGTLAVGEQARRVAGRRLAPKLEARATRKEGNATRALRRMGTYRGQATMAGQRQVKYKAQGDNKKLDRAAQQMGRHTRRADTARDVAGRSTKQAGRARTALKVLGKPSGKRVVALGGLAAAGGAGSLGVSRLRRGQGKKYTDWWDN